METCFISEDGTCFMQYLHSFSCSLLECFPLYFCWPIHFTTNYLLSVPGWEESKGIKVISRKLRIISLKPLLDSFQGSFKDNLRFFAGLYFLYRWIGLFLAATYSNYGLFYTVVEISLVIILALHAICQPYIERILNVIDTLLFADLAIINALSFANYYISQSSGDLSIIKAIYMASIQLVLIYLPIVTVVTVGILMLYCKCVSHERGQSLNGEGNTDVSGQNVFSRLLWCVISTALALALLLRKKSFLIGS